MSHKLYTIGHSATQFPAFLAMLRGSEISLLVDVRSKPQSLRFPHFDQVELERTMPMENIHYVFLGEELGGRPEDPKAYGSDGIVDYLARRKSYGFRAGIERVIKDLAKNNLALMCSEEDPLNCHRFLMICPGTCCSRSRTSSYSERGPHRISTGRRGPVAADPTMGSSCRRFAFFL